MKLVVGLGNPGAKYARTRHNAGFLVVDRVAREWAAEFNRNRFEAETAEARRGSEQILLMKPQTFMNLSGRSVGSAATFFKVPPSEILVVHDELDLPFGAVRFKKGGGAAGHNGLRSITEQLGARVIDLERRLGDTVLKPIPQRIVALVARLASASGPTVRLTHEQLADLVGTTRETVTKVLGALEARHLVSLKRGRIIVPSADALRDLADQDFSVATGG